MPQFQEYNAPNGEVILFTGNPDRQKLEALSSGPGDIWHSSFEQGFKNAFRELAYQTAVFFWYVKDFDDLDMCVSWRINPNAFAVRKSVWEFYGGFRDYDNPVMQALDFGFNALSHGALPLYVKDLFADAEPVNVKISATDRYNFFRKNFKPHHAIYMIYRKGLWKVREWAAFFKARKQAGRLPNPPYLPARPLKPLENAPTVSYIIPTMSRQDYTLQLLGDLSRQTLLPTQVVVVDATPAEVRDETLYDPANYSFRLDIIWQKSKGSCRARNEAIAICGGDYIIFGDDDIRLKTDFVENHIRFLQTYGVGAANGLDIRADHHTDGLDMLEDKLKQRKDKRYLAGAAHLMSNSNACVRRDYVDRIVGNDINYDGGYGEDNDFGLSLVKEGILMLQNPYSVNLHLKPPAGGYRVWGKQAKQTGKNRKTQPWELDSPVKSIRPVPSPTLMYYFYKQFGPELVSEYRHKYFFLYLFKGPKSGFFKRLVRLPYRQLQFRKSVFYAKKLLALGKRTK